MAPIGRGGTIEDRPPIPANKAVPDERIRAVRERTFFFFSAESDDRESLGRQYGVEE